MAVGAKLRAIKLLMYILLVVNAFILLFQINSFQTASSYKLVSHTFVSLANSRDKGIHIQRCELLKVSPYNKDVIPFLKEPEPVNCVTEFYGNKTFKKIAFELKNGYYLHQLEDVGYPCCMAQFKMKNNNEIKISRKCIPISQNITKIPTDFEYIDIRCMDERNTVMYRDAFPVVHPISPRSLPNEIKESTAGKNKIEQKLNIMILVLESTSQQNFYRQMPKSRAYLSNNLSAISFKLYNKIGYNTHPNMVALLSGLSVKEFAKDCRKFQKDEAAQPTLKDCPLIWKNFSDRGYVTAFMEDCTIWPIFNYYYWSDSFTAYPTNYYYFPYAIHVDGSFKQSKRAWCHGPRSTFESMFDFGKLISEIAVMTDTPFFQFIFSSRQTYKDMNSLGLLDKQMVKMLKQMESSNVLNSTALFVLGDHGYRYYSNLYAQTDSGEIEDRMPVGYAVLPKWFKREYPTASMNLRRNAEKRITAYDVHATLVDLMNLENIQLTNSDGQHYSQKGRGISLFRNIPEDRTCLQAGIPLQWCLTCFQKIPLLVYEDDVPPPMAEEAAKMIINSINEMTTKYHKKDHFLCTPLKLNSIDNVWKWDPRDVYSELCDQPVQFRDRSEEKVSISCGYMDALEVVKVNLITSPNNGMFEGEVVRLQNGDWLMMEKALRVDAYYDQSWCVEDTEIKPYCYCDPKLRHSTISL